MWFHEVGCKYRVNNVCYQQRCKQRNNKSYWEEIHELSDNTRPEHERDEWSKHNQCSGKHGKENFASRNLCSLSNWNFTIIKYAVRIFNYHDRIIHHNTECQHEAEQ